MPSDLRHEILRQLASSPHFAWHPKIHRVRIERQFFPDLEDPATRGILLEQARAAWGKPHLYVYYNAVKEVFCVGGGLPVPAMIEGPTEGATIARAILAAPEVSPKDRPAPPKKIFTVAHLSGAPWARVDRLRWEAAVNRKKGILQEGGPFCVVWAGSTMRIHTNRPPLRASEEILVTTDSETPPLASTFTEIINRKEERLAGIASGALASQLDLAIQVAQLTDIRDLWETAPSEVTLWVLSLEETPWMARFRVSEKKGFSSESKDYTTCDQEDLAQVGPALLALAQSAISAAIEGGVGLVVPQRHAP